MSWAKITYQGGDLFGYVSFCLTLKRNVQKVMNKC